MRLNPWMLPFVLSAALLTTTGYVFADSDDANSEQQQPMDDEALEEEYGIKAGSVKREEVATREEETDVAQEPDNSKESSPDAGTGGTGSAEVDIDSSEEKNKEESDTGGE